MQTHPNEHFAFHPPGKLKWRQLKFNKIMKSHWPISAYWVSLKAWIRLTSFSSFSTPHTHLHAHTYRDHAWTHICTRWWQIFCALVWFNPNQSQTRKVECKCHPNSRSWHCWLRLNVCVSLRSHCFCAMCWRPCHRSEPWPWPRQWVGTWTHADELAVTRTPVFPAESHAGFVTFWVDTQTWLL